MLIKWLHCHLITTYSYEGEVKYKVEKNSKSVFSDEGFSPGSYPVCYVLVSWHKTTEEILERISPIQPSDALSSNMSYTFSQLSSRPGLWQLGYNPLLPLSGELLTANVTFACHFKLSKVLSV